MKPVRVMAPEPSTVKKEPVEAGPVDELTQL